MTKVLVAPLDWGLGHATRCIPVIRSLLNRGAQVMIAGHGDSLEVLKKEFPSLPWEALPGYNPTYSSGNMMVLRIAAQIPRFISVIHQEHKIVKDIVARHNVDLVISDNRYGCWASQAHCVLMIHQINILIPRYLGVTGFINRYHARLIRKFDECWIPDFPGTHSLAGKLTETRKVRLHKIKFIGNLSRFESAPEITDNRLDLVVLLSGPEPQRSRLEEIIVPQLLNSGMKYVLVRGLISPHIPLPPSVNAINFLNGNDLQGLILRADCVIARSGYSTVMDLARLRKRAIFIPTPGQTEQEYIGKRLMKMRIAPCFGQRDFRLSAAIKRSKSYIGFNFTSDRFNLLDVGLDETFATLKAG